MKTGIRSFSKAPEESRGEISAIAPSKRKTAIPHRKRNWFGLLIFCINRYNYGDKVSFGLEFRKMNKSRGKLKLILRGKSILLGNFTLASGKQSSCYINAGLTTLDTEGADLISEILPGESAAHGGVTAVGVPSAGAGPVAGAIISRSHEEGLPLRGFIVRKKEKEHGTENLTEGGLCEGDKVAIAEDGIATGGFALRGIDIVESAGAEVRRVFCVVYRGEETERTSLENSTQNPFVFSRKPE